MKQFNILLNEGGDDLGGGSLLGGGGAATADASASLIASTTPQATASQANPTGATATGSGAFDFRTIVGDDGNFTADFRSKLPENLKGLEKFKSPEQVLAGYTNLEKLMGAKANAVVIPGADATKEEWAPILKRLGVPDSPEGYGLKVPENLPDGVTVNQEELNQFAKYAHQIGLTPQQVAKLQEYDMTRAGTGAASSIEQAKAMEVQEFTKQTEILSKAWGTGPESTQKKALAERAALTFGFTPQEIGEDPLFRNARFVMTMARAGAAMSEDTLVKSSEINHIGGLKAKAQDVISNPQNPLYKRYWSGDADANAQVQAWMRAG